MYLDNRLDDHSFLLFGGSLALLARGGDFGKSSFLTCSDNAWILLVSFF